MAINEGLSSLLKTKIHDRREIVKVTAEYLALDREFMGADFSTAVLVDDKRARVFVQETDGDPFLLRFAGSFSAIEEIRDGALLLCNPKDFIKGYVEKVDGTLVCGWIGNLLSNDCSQIELWNGRTLISIGMPIATRPDISALGFRASLHGFRLKIPIALFRPINGLIVRSALGSVELPWTRIRKDQSIWPENQLAVVKQRSYSGVDLEIERALSRFEIASLPPPPVRRLTLTSGGRCLLSETLGVLSRNDLLLSAEIVEFLLSPGDNRATAVSNEACLKDIVHWRGPARPTVVTFSSDRRASVDATSVICAVNDEIFVSNLSACTPLSPLSSVMLAAAYLHAKPSTDGRLLAKAEDLAAGMKLIESTAILLITTPGATPPDEALLNHLARVFSARVLQLTDNGYDFKIWMDGKCIRRVLCSSIELGRRPLSALISEIAHSRPAHGASPARKDGYLAILTPWGNTSAPYLAAIDDLCLPDSNATRPNYFPHEYKLEDESESSLTVIAVIAASSSHGLYRADKSTAQFVTRVANCKRTVPVLSAPTA